MEENARLSRELNKIDEKLKKKFCFKRSKLTWQAMQIERDIQDNEDEIRWNNDIAVRIKTTDEKIVQRQKEAEDLIEVLRQILHNEFAYRKEEDLPRVKTMLNRVLRWQNNPMRPEIK